MLDKLISYYGRQFHEAVKAVRALNKDGHDVNPEYVRGQVELILNMGMFTETVESEQLMDFIFPSITEFTLQGVNATLKAVDSDLFWDGWRVPSVTSSQLLDYLNEARHDLSDDAYRTLMSDIFSVYGDTFSEDNPHQPMAETGLKWELARQSQNSRNG